MSRTDHHNPNRVRAHQAHADGLGTEEHHASTCVEYRNTHWARGWPFIRSHVTRRVEHAVAEANNWEPSPHWGEYTTASHGYYRVPVQVHECDIDLVHGRCTRWIDDRDRMPYTGPIGKANRRTYYFAPERAAVRDALRAVAQEYRGSGEIDTEVPTRQHRHAMWRGGYWD